MRKIGHTDAAPAPVGACSRGTTDELVFTADRIALTPDGEPVAAAPIAERTGRALEVGALPKGADVETDAVAVHE